jgi:hypothetical protein
MNLIPLMIQVHDLIDPFPNVDIVKIIYECDSIMKMCVFFIRMTHVIMLAWIRGLIRHRI